MFIEGSNEADMLRLLGPGEVARALADPRDGRDSSDKPAKAASWQVPAFSRFGSCCVCGCESRALARSILGARPDVVRSTTSDNRMARRGCTHHLLAGRRSACGMA